jgi:hypothetical protein
MLALALLAPALVPLAALGVASDWWFLRSDDPPPVRAPAVVKEGSWSGHPWQLIAYRSGTDDLCVSVTAAGSNASGSGGATGCAPFVGVSGTAETKGPVTDKASTVEIQFGTGAVLRLPTFSGAASLGHVRFYAAQLPASIPMPQSDLRNQSQRSFINTLAGLDSDGNVVACLAPRTMVDRVSPLSDCQ